MKSKGQRTVEQMKGRATCGPLGSGTRSKRVKAEWRAYCALPALRNTAKPSLRKYAALSHAQSEARRWLELKIANRHR